MQKLLKIKILKKKSIKIQDPIKNCELCFAASLVFFDLEQLPHYFILHDTDTLEESRPAVL